MFKETHADFKCNGGSRNGGTEVGLGLSLENLKRKEENRLCFSLFPASFKTGNTSN